MTIPHVKAHSDHPRNDVADELAKLGATAAGMIESPHDPHRSANAYSARQAQAQTGTHTPHHPESSESQATHNLTTPRRTVNSTPLGTRRHSSGGATGRQDTGVEHDADLRV